MTETPPPRIAGNVKIHENWSLNLPGPFNQKVEGNALVFWNDNLTIWIKSYNNTAKASINDRLNQAVSNASRDAKEKIRDVKNEIGQFSYRLVEEAPKGAARGALYTYKFNPSSHVSVAFYGSDEDQIRIARIIFDTITPV